MWRDKPDPTADSLLERLLIKRHMAVDINGLPQAILVTRANVSDRSGALAMFSLASQNLVQHVMVDGGYTGNDFALNVHGVG
ncbi:hypothetical protein FAM18110_00636 [Lacticaseibacillus paracasei]|nr:hypothetical protein FAM18110_00636 [Lacticaseibacillus paracasei]